MRIILYKNIPHTVDVRLIKEFFLLPHWEHKKIIGGLNKGGFKLYIAILFFEVSIRIKTT